MARLGRQSPTFEVVGGWAHSDVDECVSALSELGASFDQAQEHELELFLARTVDGRPAAVTIGLSKPRQNGKSYTARWYAIWCAAVLGLSVVYSAHNGDTVNEFFNMVCEVFAPSDEGPDLSQLLDGEPYRQPGKERIRFVGGGRIKFVTRTNSRSRGGTCDVLIVDEAQELTESQLNAILPVVSAGPHGMPQIVYVGTPPDPSCAGTVFARMHDAAHSDDPGDAWWVEWAITSLPPEDATVEDLIELAYETNAAMGSRITEAAVRNEIATMGRDGLARERFGWWRPGSVRPTPLIDPAAWAACLTDAPAMRGKTAYGVKFSSDGTSWALSAAVVPASGPAHVELVDIGPAPSGLDRLAAWIAARRDGCAVCKVDGKSYAAMLRERLVSRGLPARAVDVCEPRDVCAAASSMLAEIAAQTVTHIESPAMDESATGSVKRLIGSGGGFGFGDGPDSVSYPIESGALALWGARTTRRDPTRRQVVW